MKFVAAWSKAHDCYLVGLGYPDGTTAKVVEGPPTCHFCDNRNHEVVGAVLHTGAPVCAACMAEIKKSAVM